MRDVSRRASVVTLTRGCLDAVAQMSAAGERALIDAGELHALFIKLVDDMRRRARASGIDGRELEDISYAVVALIDEVAIARGGEIRNAWMMEPLQVRYFNETTAGDTFFRRLSALADGREREPALFVYYLCLLFGFRGRYGIRGRESELARVIEELHEQLFPPGDDLPPLAPDGAPPERRVEEQRRALPWRWVGGLVFALGLALHVALWLVARSGCAELRAAAVAAAAGHADEGPVADVDGLEETP